jgi:hypothetical protein
LSFAGCDLFATQRMLAYNAAKTWHLGDTHDWRASGEWASGSITVTDGAGSVSL